MARKTAQKQSGDVRDQKASINTPSTTNTTAATTATTGNKRKRQSTEPAADGGPPSPDDTLSASGLSRRQSVATSVTSYRTALNEPYTTETAVWAVPNRFNAGPTLWAIYNDLRVMMNRIDDLEKRMMLTAKSTRGSKQGGDESTMKLRRHDLKEIEVVAHEHWEGSLRDLFVPGAEEKKWEPKQMASTHAPREAKKFFEQVVKQVQAYNDRVDEEAGQDGEERDDQGYHPFSATMEDLHKDENKQVDLFVACSRIYNQALKGEGTAKDQFKHQDQQTGKGKGREKEKEKEKKKPTSRVRSKRQIVEDEEEDEYVEDDDDDRDDIVTSRDPSQ